MADKKPKKLSLDELAAQYGYAAAFFFSDPELRRLIERAVKEQWTAAKFQAKFMATKWYRTRSADTRSWLELVARDPAEASARRKERTTQVQTMATQMGISLDSGRLSRLVEDSLMFGWGDELLRQSVAVEFKFRPGGGTQGQAATMEDFIRRTANDFGITVSDDQIGRWVGGALAGTFTEDHLADFVKDMARSKYPGLTPYLDMGLSVRDVADPYIQSYSQILEVPSNAVQLSDGNIQRALQGVAPDKPGGIPQAQTLYEFERDLRKDPRWRRTKNARESMTNVGLGVLRDMGIFA